MAQSDAINQTTESEERPSGHRSKAIIFVFIVLGVLLLGLLIGVNKANKSANEKSVLNSTDAKDGEQLVDAAARETKSGSLQNMFNERNPFAQAQQPAENLEPVEQVESAQDKYNRQDKLQNQLSELLRQRETEKADTKQQLLMQALMDDIGLNTTGINEGRQGNSGTAQINNSPATANSEWSSVRERLNAINQRKAEYQQSAQQNSASPEVAGSLSFGGFESAGPGTGPEIAALDTGSEFSGIGYDDAGQDVAGMIIPPTTVIDGVLNQAIKTDVPGNCVGLIRHNIYNLERTHVLIPQGSKLNCTIKAYSGQNEAIQDRVVIGVHQIIRPDGSVIALNDLAGLNFDGSGGVPGDVDRHLFAQTMGTLAYALIGKGPELLISGDTESTNDSAAADIYGDISDQFEPLASKYLNIVPTVTLPRGTPIKVVLNQTLKVKPYRSLESFDFGGL